MSLLLPNVFFGGTDVGGVVPAASQVFFSSYRFKVGGVVPAASPFFFGDADFGGLSLLLPPFFLEVQMFGGVVPAASQFFGRTDLRLERLSLLLPRNVSGRIQIELRCFNSHLPRRLLSMFFSILQFLGPPKKLLPDLFFLIPKNGMIYVLFSVFCQKIGAQA